MLFAIHTEMRTGEILGLTWAGVDLFRRTVMVQIEERRTTHHPAQSDRSRTAEAEIWKSVSGNGVGGSERSTDTVECEQYQPKSPSGSEESQDDRFPFP